MALGVLLVFAGCARAGGDWPSLARREAERQPAAEVVDEGSAVAVAPARVSVAQRRLLDERWTVAERERLALASRLAVQVRATEAAVARVRGGSPQDDPWAAAQLELTRLERMAADLDDLGRRISEAVPAASAREQRLAADIEAMRARLSGVVEAARRALVR